MPKFTPAATFLISPSSISAAVALTFKVICLVTPLKVYLNTYAPGIVVLDTLKINGVAFDLSPAATFIKPSEVAIAVAPAGTETCSSLNAN